MVLNILNFSTKTPQTQFKSQAMNKTQKMENAAEYQKMQTQHGKPTASFPCIQFCLVHFGHIKKCNMRSLMQSHAAALKESSVLQNDAFQQRQTH